MSTCQTEAWPSPRDRRASERRIRERKPATGSVAASCAGRRPVPNSQATAGQGMRGGPQRRVCPQGCPRQPQGAGDRQTCLQIQMCFTAGALPPSCSLPWQRHTPLRLPKGSHVARGGISGPLRAGAGTPGGGMEEAASLSFESPPFPWVTRGQACPLPAGPPDKVAFDGRRSGRWCAGPLPLAVCRVGVHPQRWELGRLRLGIGWGRLRWDRR